MRDKPGKTPQKYSSVCGLGNVCPGLHSKGEPGWLVEIVSHGQRRHQPAISQARGTHMVLIDLEKVVWSISIEPLSPVPAQLAPVVAG